MIARRLQRAHPGRRIRGIVAALLWLAAGSSAQAAHPLATEDTGTQGAGRWQLELANGISRERGAGVVQRRLQPAAVLAHGVLDNLDVQVGLAWQRASSDDGLARTVEKGLMDTSLEAKWRFFSRGDLSIALMPGLTFATGDEQRGLGTGRSTWGGRAIVSFEPEDWALHAHAAARRNRNRIDKRGTVLQLAVAATWKARKGVRLIADLNGETDPDRSRNDAVRQLTLGAIYSPVETLDLSVGLRRGRPDGASERALLVGATLRW